MLALALDPAASPVPPSWELGGAGWAVIIVLASVLVWGVFLGLRIARWRVERRADRSRRTGEAGERRALRLLRRQGFRVVEVQPVGSVRALVDGRLHSYAVRADALATRRGRVYVAEVKAGEHSSRLANRATRRQLLEYAHAFDADGLLLVDAFRGRVVEVAFLGPAVGEDEDEDDELDGERGDGDADSEVDDDEGEWPAQDELPVAAHG